MEIKGKRGTHASISEFLLPYFQTSVSFHPEKTVKHALGEAARVEAEEVGEDPVQQGGGTQGQVESLHLQEVGAADPLEHLAG